MKDHHRGEAELYTALEDLAAEHPEPAIRERASRLLKTKNPREISTFRGFLHFLDHILTSF